MPSDLFTMLWAKKMKAIPEQEITGTLPLSFIGKAQKALTDYTLYGTSEGAGVETESGEPAGYKILLTNTSGVTENLCNSVELGGGNTSLRLYFDKEKISSETSTLFVSINSGTFELSQVSVYLGSTYKRPISGTGSFYFSLDLSSQDIEDIEASANPYIRLYKSTGSMALITDEMITLSTPPSSYIPHRYVDTYPLYIGDTKLGEEEYVDYATQKIYKLPEPVIYGWHVDPSISDPAQAITYLEDAIGKTHAAMGSTAFSYGDWQDAFFMPKPCMLKSDGTVDYYLDPNDYSKKLDGTASDYNNLAYDGNVMIEFPKIYYKYEAGEAEGEGYFYCSNYKVDDSYECWCNYDCDDNVTEHFYVAAYNSVIYDNKMRSISGHKLIDKVSTAYDNTATYAVGAQVFTNDRQYKCITAVETPEAFDPTKWEQVPFNGNTTGQLEVDTATANNTTAKVEWYTDVWSDCMLINGLLILMGKSLNSQAVYGNGIQSSNQAAKNNYTTGTANSNGMFYGSTSANNEPVKVFGIENWWGCVWHRTAGLMPASDSYVYKLTYGTADGTSALGYNSTGTGYNSSNILRPAKGYINKATYGKFGYLPSATSNSSSSIYYSDYYYKGSTSGYGVLGGGASSYAGDAGISCLNCSGAYTTANWSISTSLSCKPLSKGGDDYIPTDPPSPLPAITAYQGENALSSTETVGSVTVKGYITAAT